VIATGVFLFICVVVDCMLRRLPNLLMGGLYALAILGSWILGSEAWSWSWWGMAGGLGLGLVADFPGGDVKFMGLLGGLVGISFIFIGTIIVAFGLTSLCWRTSLTPLPWTPYAFIGWIWSIGMDWIVSR
jgi:hypothetical protein